MGPTPDSKVPGVKASAPKPTPDSKAPEAKVPAEAVPDSKAQVAYVAQALVVVGGRLVYPGEPFTAAADVPPGRGWKRLEAAVGEVQAPAAPKKARTADL